MAIQSINPATGSIDKTFSELTDNEIQVKLDAAQTAFTGWSRLAYAERAKYFLKLAQVLKQNDRRYAAIITKEMGMPIRAAIASVNKCAWNCEYFADQTQEFLKEEHIKTEASDSYVRFDPLGIILFVMPWNFPFWQVFRQAVTNLMAGNVAVLKHASNVPQSALAIEQAFRQAGFPANVFQTLLISAAKVESVLKDFRVKGVSLTGSVAAGAKVGAIAGREIKCGVMELGGSDPFIILKDAEVSVACEISVQSRLINTGQSCIAAKRFIVVADVYDEFISLQKSKFAGLVVGDPMDESVTVGPLANEKGLADIIRQVDESVANGAHILIGGQRLARPGFFYEPTILTEVKPGMPVYDEEVFGPVAAVIKVKNEAEAIRVANDTKYGLAASLWTKDIAKAKQLAVQINSGAVYINSLVKSDPRLPFGGVNYGGYGRELSAYGLKEFVNIKTVSVK